MKKIACLVFGNTSLGSYFHLAFFRLWYLDKGDVDIMKHQVDQSQFKKWLIIGGISFFIFSVVIPTRYLFDVENVSVVLSILAIPVAYSTRGASW